MNTTWRVTGAMVLALSCLGGASGCGSRQTEARSARNESMSAEKHEQEAAKLVARANDEAQVSESEAPPPNLTVNPTGNPQGYYYPVNPSVPPANPARVQRLDRHAREHLVIATGMKVFEDDACRDVPAAERPTCPLLGPVAALDDIPGGVRVRFTEKANVDAIADKIRCHLAYARARGFEQVASCPLYVRGVALNRTDVPNTLDLTSANPTVTTEIRKRAREEALLARGPNP